MSHKNFLEVDESIIEKNFLIQSNEEHEFEEFVSGFLNPNYGKLVRPVPGICIKVLKIDDKSKVFINLCHHDDIPAPDNITQKELIEVLSSNDPERYCVPLSIGTEHEETDKSGALVKAYDVAVNSDFFNKCQSDEIFQTFIISASIEGVAEKFKIEISSENPILLKNRKCIGKLQEHRIKQRPIKSSSIKKKPLIQEVNCNDLFGKLNKYTAPEYKIYLQHEVHPKKLIIDIWLPDVNNSQDINLKCGEDCLVLTTNKNTIYELDICLPYKIYQKSINVTFYTSIKILSVISSILNID